MVVVASQLLDEVTDVVYLVEPYSLRGDHGTRNGDEGALRGDLRVLVGVVTEDGEVWVVGGVGG